MLPGINDGHLHFVESAVSEHGTLSVGSHVAGSWAEVVRILEDAAPASDGWIRAHGWDEAVLGHGGPEHVFGLRPDSPLVAYDQTGHQLLMNETAARLAGLDSWTGGYPDGVVGSFADGRANGLLVDAAVELAGKVVPQLGDAELKECIIKHQRLLHSLGITSLTEPGLGPGGEGLFGGSSATRSLSLLADLAADGELTLRINVLLLFSSTGGANENDVRTGLAGDLPGSLRRRGISEDLLRIAGVKIFADGIPRSGTAWMSEPYETPCGHNHGSMVIAGDSDAEREQELRKIIARIHDGGFQAGIHATGDATTDAAIGAIAEAQGKNPRDARHYIIHGAFNGPGIHRQVPTPRRGPEHEPDHSFGGRGPDEEDPGRGKVRRAAAAVLAARGGSADEHRLGRAGDLAGLAGIGHRGRHPGHHRGTGRPRRPRAGRLPAGAGDDDHPPRLAGPRGGPQGAPCPRLPRGPLHSRKTHRR